MVGISGEWETFGVWWRSGIALVVMLCTGCDAVYAEPPQQNAQPLAGKTILFAVANREADPFNTQAEGASRLASLLTRSGAQIDTLNWLAPIPTDTDLVILAGAFFNYSGDRVVRLLTYIEAGGSVFLLLDPPVEERSVQASNSMFPLLWSDFGIRTTDYIAINPRQEALPLAPPETQSSLGTPIATQVLFTSSSVPPQFINQVSSSNPNHPILQGVGFGTLAFDGLRPLQARTSLPDVTITELLVTDEQPYGESDYVAFAESGFYAYDEAADADRGSFIAAVASENPATGSRIVVVGDGSITRNDFGFSTSPPMSESFVYVDTVRFVLNAIHWLLDVEAPTP